MRLTAAAILAVLAAAALLFWTSGALELVLFRVSQAQHAAQTVLAGRLQELRSGAPGALWSLTAICFGYGVLHAVGPGHGKAVVAGAAVGLRATAWRMAAIAVLGSLAQAAVAVALVYGGFTLFALSARGAVDVAERWVAPVGNLAIAAIGAWLLLRGLRALVRAPHGHGRGPSPRPATAMAMATTPEADGCANCGHAHGPTLAETGRATGVGPTLALIGAMAARPCTGALFVLVIAWRFDLAAAGAAAVVAMGLGVAAVTVLVAILAVTGRDAAIFTAGRGPAARLVAPGLQIVAGGTILMVGGALVLGTLPA